MSGFSPEWLALREPADVAARSAKVLKSCEDYFRNHQSVAICDMGAGTGASIRAFAPLLPRAQQWTLIDHDAANLVEAKRRHPDIQTNVRDFASDPDCWAVGTNLVTTTALLDLTSRAWIDRFVAALVSKRLPVLCTLTVDDVLSVTPVQAWDDAVFDAFRAHQHSDKGFGPALGGEAAEYFETALERAGYDITADDSPWRIGRGELLRALLDGMAGAVRETGRVPAIDEWLNDAQAKTTLLVVGHRDVFAAPR